MWQKVHPIGMRVWIMKSRPCEWFAKDPWQESSFLVEDIKLRTFVDDAYKHAGVSKVVIRKTATEGEIIIFSSKVGSIMGKNGEKLKKFEDKVQKKFDKPFKVTVKEVRNPELSAKVMAEYVAHQLENRMPYRRVAKSAMQKIMEKGAIGVKIQVGWRLWWADIARTEKFIEWRVSLQTFRSDIDYHYLQSNTKYGVLGVKVWIGKWTLYKRWEKKQKPTVSFT